MGLTEIQKRVIRELADNNLEKAKQWAIASLEEDKTQKNKSFCEKYSSILKNRVILEQELLEIPPNLSGVISIESIPKDFLEKRYFLSDRERNVLNDIMKMSTIRDKLSELKIPYPNSTLLFGESGTGKTTFAKYVAHEMDLPFCYLNFSDLINSLMGETSKKLSLVFNFIKSTPCVFMIDEIDAIATKRTGIGGGSEAETNRILITLLQELDRLPNTAILISATNRIDVLDEAIVRRFSIKHKVNVFSQEENLILLHQYIDDTGIKFTEEEIFELLKSNQNQALLLNALIREMGNKLLEEIDKDL